jgi:hypothetical protein
MLQAGKSLARVADDVDFFIRTRTRLISGIHVTISNPSSHTMALESTQPLTEISTRNLPGGKKRPARGADNLAAVCEPNV